jgi:hypothetical protein
VPATAVEPPWMLSLIFGAAPFALVGIALIVGFTHVGISFIPVRL